MKLNRILINNFISIGFLFNLVKHIVCSPKKLSFLFKHKEDPDLDYYCPQKHFASRIEDLCYYIPTSKKTHKTAENMCKKKSHRLAEIESQLIFESVLDTLHKYYLTTKEISPEEDANKKYHLGSIYKIENGEQKIYWNESNLLIDESLLCKKLKFKSHEILINPSYSCIELIYNDSNYRSENGKNSCLKLVDCQSVKYSICEWRGNDIKSYNLELKEQIINAHISVLFVASLFNFIWFILYALHKRRVRYQLDLALNNYKDELRIFSIDPNQVEV